MAIGKPCYTTFVRRFVLNTKYHGYGFIDSSFWLLMEMMGIGMTS